MNNELIINVTLFFSKAASIALFVMCSYAFLKYRQTFLLLYALFSGIAVVLGITQLPCLVVLEPVSIVLFVTAMGMTIRYVGEKERTR